MNERKVPEVRFRGFSGEWEKREFTEVIERTSTICDDAKLPRVEYEDITPEYGKLNKNIYAKESKKTGLLFESGDILFGKLRPYLKNWLVSDFRGIAVGDFWIFTPNKAVGNFAFYLIQNSSFQYVANLSSGTKMPRSDWNIVSKSKFAIAANQAEQTKIGEFFKNLDDLIAQNQKKYDKLVHMKKACLNKLFPKDGADTPEVRFKGFSGEWERLKLSDVADIIGGGTPSTQIPEYWNGEIAWYSPTEIGKFVYADRSQKTITELGFEKCSAKMLPANITVLFTSRAGIGDMAILRHVATTNQGFQSFVLKDGYNTYFLYSSGCYIKSYALKNACGSTFLEISGKQLGKMDYTLPDEKEQTKIGTFFQTLDNLITLRKTELEKLKNIKKACLDKMFI